MGNVRANSILEMRLKQAVDVRKPRADADSHHRCNYIHGKYEALRYCGNKADFPLFSEGITQSQSRLASSPRASADDLDYDRIVKSGGVMKKKMGKNWKKRYLVLTPQHLAYFDDIEARGEWGLCVSRACTCALIDIARTLAQCVCCAVAFPFPSLPEKLLTDAHALLRHAECSPAVGHHRTRQCSRQNDRAGRQVCFSRWRRFIRLHL